MQPAATDSPPRLLLVPGAFGMEGALRRVEDWGRTVVLEVDAFLPAELRKRCAACVTVPPLLPEAEAEELQTRAEELLEEFLEERAPVEGLETGRLFRAACMSIEAWRIVVPHLVCLKYARLALEHGPFSRVIAAPGAGISMRALEQISRAAGAPLTLLPQDREQPPFTWMLKRRWHRFLLKRRARRKSGPAARLPQAAGTGGLWCADPRLESMVARDDKAGQWAAGPAFAEPDAAELEALRTRYEAWWDAWWQQWRGAHPGEEVLSPRFILEDVGRWFSRHRYPLHALYLRQAREQVAKARPECVLLGSMRGRREFLWGLAARELGIPAAVYTVDCSVYPRLVFKPDIVLCDDARQWGIATRQAELDPRRVLQVSSHRRPPGRAAGTAAAPAGQGRRVILLADTYYSGMVASSSPLLSAWAYERVVEAAREMPEHDFLIKFHPVRERPEAAFHLSGLHHLQLWLREKFIRTLRPPRNVRLLAPEVPLSDWLPKAALLLNIQSYAGLEAFALGIPVVYLQPWDEEGLYPEMNARGAMQVAVDGPRLVELARRNLDDPAHRQAQLARQAAYLDYFYWQGRPTCAQAAAQAALEPPRLTA